MSNVICFFTRKPIETPKEDRTKPLIERPAKPKNLKQKPMTAKELAIMSKRMDEIQEAIDLCDDSGRDQDVLDNLEKELEGLVKTLKASHALALKAEHEAKRKAK